MKAIHDQSHYEVLEVRYGASQEEIERAYRMVRATYDQNSLALYSVFGARDADVIRERVDEAHRVLSDPSARRAYDESQPVTAVAMQATGGDAASVIEPGLAEAEREAAAPGRSGDADAGQLFADAGESYRELEADIEDETGEFDGPTLRRARLRRGIEVDHVSEITKVSPAHIRNIESDNFADLPAPVYVRGFVKAYARTIGLDPERVAGSYMARVEAARAGHGRGRFLVRR